MPSLLQQQIEALSREKNIDPQIVIGAVEDAIAVATRKNLKSQENLRGMLDPEIGDDRGVRGEDHRRERR